MLFQFMHYLKNEMGLVGFVLFSLWVGFLVILDMTLGSLDFDREEVVVPPPLIQPDGPPVIVDRPVTPSPPPRPPVQTLPPKPREESPPPQPPKEGCLDVEGTQLCLDG